MSASPSSTQRLVPGGGGGAGSKSGSLLGALPSLGAGLVSGACLVLVISAASGGGNTVISSHAPQSGDASSSAAKVGASSSSSSSPNALAAVPSTASTTSSSSQQKRAALLSAATRPSAAEAERCVTRFVKYTPSVFEDKWFATATPEHAKKQGLCQLFVSPPFRKWADTYMDDCEANRLAPHLRPTSLPTAAARPNLKALDPDVYSSFEYERICYDGAEDFEETVNSPLILSDVTALEPVLVPPRRQQGQRLYGEGSSDAESPPAAVAGASAAATEAAAFANGCGLVCGGRATDSSFVWPPSVSPSGSHSAIAAHRQKQPQGDLVLRMAKVRRVRFLTYIEPLVGIVRDPRICGWAKSPHPTQHVRNTFEGRFVPTKNWLLIDPLATYTNASFPTRRFLFDMGASTWGAGAGGASQSWFYDTYRTYGADLNEVYAWELTQVDAKKFFSDIPDHLKPSYHYFNEGMSPAWPSWDNPMLHVLQRTSPDDFVVVKLDIDAGHIEGGIVDEIIGDAQISNRIDEFFFEHHVYLEILYRHWGNSIHATRNYVDSLHLFANMRHRGIRAHSWV